jgi:hypothetical protein
MGRGGRGYLASGGDMTRRKQVMAGKGIVSRFSTNRLNGEPVPDDVKILLKHADELAERTEIELHAEKNWVPWTDTSSLSAADLANPDIAANVRAVAEIHQMIAYIAADDEDQYFGYWRGPENRSVASSPLVFFDNEGQFDLCPGRTFAEAVLSRVPDEQFEELRDWFGEIGIEVAAQTQDELLPASETESPTELHHERYCRYKG